MWLGSLIAEDLEMMSRLLYASARASWRSIAEKDQRETG